MKKVFLSMEVWVLEESDVVGITEDARVRGELGAVIAKMDAVLPPNVSTSVGLKHDARRGSVPWVSVAGHQCEVGDGVAFHSALPGGSLAVPEILLLDATDAPEVV